MAPEAALLSDFRAASRTLHDAFVPLIGVVPTGDLREELDGQIGRLQGLLDLHVAEAGI